MEQTVIRFLYLKGHTQNEAFDEMKELCRDDVPSYDVVKQWQTQFKCGHKSVETARMLGALSLSFVMQPSNQNVHSKVLWNFDGDLTGEQMTDYKKLKKKAERNGDLRAQADACRNIGEIYSRNEEFDDAIEEHREELLLCEALNSTLSIALANRNLGEIFAKKQMFDKAVPLHKRYLALARECANELEEQRALATLGSTYLGQCEMEDTCKGKRETYRLAKDCFMHGLEVTEGLQSTLKEVDYMDMKGRLYQNLGLLYDEMNEPETSSKYFQQALAINGKYNLTENLFMCQSSMISVYQKYNKITEARRYADLCLETAKKMKVKENEALALISKAMVLVNQKEYDESRHLLKKAYKLGTPSQKEECKRSYKSVKTIHKGADVLSSNTNTRTGTKFQWLDKMGDSAAELGLYKLAIKFYQKLLEASKENLKSKQDIAKVHISLAETCKDDKQFTNAIDHYQEEIKCYRAEEQDQVCKSWLNIGAIEEMKYEGYEQPKESYQRAYNAARHAKKGKLMIVALENLIALFKYHKQEELLRQAKEKLTHICSKYHLSERDIGDVSQNEEEDEEITEECVSEMSDLTESEDDEVPGSTVSMNTSRVGKTTNSKKMKRNLKGETPLHVACIEGKLKEVSKLISQGHPVNVQDYGGWTPLHEASNHGHTEIVRLLLECGADVNNRGGSECGGLTPLMDAASNGEIECVELMLDSGANVIAKDDENMTVLDHLNEYFQRTREDLDSSEKNQCIRLAERLKDKLPNRKAPPKIMHSQKKALIPESEIVGSSGGRKRSRNDIINDYSSDSSDDGLTAGRRRNSRKRSPSPMVESDSQVSDSQVSDTDDVLYTVHDQDLNIDKNATAVYKSAMASIGSSAQRSSQVTKKSPKTSNKKTALIMEEDYVQDDWLIDDLKPVAKRRKMGVDGYSLTSGLINDKENISTNTSARTVKRKMSSVICDNDSDSECAASVPPDQPAPTVQQASTSTVWQELGDVCDLTGVTQTDDDLPEFTSNSAIRNNVRKLSLEKNRSRQTKLTDFGTSIPSSSQTVIVHNVDNSNQHQQSNQHKQCNQHRQVASVGLNTNCSNCIPSQPTSKVMKIKVQIEDKLLLVPVIDYQRNKTVSAFIVDVSERYYKLFGLRPQLTLGTVEGARFSPDDLVSVILTDGEKIEGFLEGWQVPSMSEQYKTACKSLKTVYYKNIELQMKSCENHTSILDLTNLSLRIQKFTPVLEALKHQSSLRQLELKGNRIEDQGIERLSTVLKTLPNLTSLGLCCNNITGRGLRAISEAVAQDKDNTLTNLTSLDLSYNPLGDICRGNLVSVIRSLLSLDKLCVASCNLTSDFFRNDRRLIMQALHVSHIQHIDVSYNNLGDLGVYFLLGCQNPKTVLSMNLSATVRRPSRRVWEYLARYVARDGCVLEKLEMCKVPVKHDTCDEMKSFMESASHLQSLDLSSTKLIKNEMMQSLLQGACRESSMLEHLKLNNCGISAPLSLEFIDTISDQLAMPCAIRELEFTCEGLNKVDADSLTYIWKEKWDDTAEVIIEGNSLKFSVMSSG